MNRLQEAAESPHAAFLRAIQEWVWQRYPTRQLSASDVFYCLKWAESHIPASEFIHQFDSYLLSHPHHLDEGCKLSRLQFEANKIIHAHQKDVQSAPQMTEIPDFNNPYDTALNYITACGQRTHNPILKDELRKLYTLFKSSKKQATIKYPDWNRQTEEYYKYKAEAFLLWQDAIQQLCRYCMSILSDIEQKEMHQLTPAEQIHCFQLGPEAETIYKERVLREKIARYFDFEELLNTI